MVHMSALARSAGFYRRVLVLPLALAAAACSGGTTVARCTGDEQCHGGRCVAGRCVIPDGGVGDGPCVLACGSGCCGAGETCEVGVCRRDCGSQERCTNGAGVDACCAAATVCYFGACVTPGAACTFSEQCPDGQYCEATLGRCLPKAAQTSCEYRPPTGVFTPTLEWEWQGDPHAEHLPAYNQVMSMPIVVNLNDDNGDGVVDEKDTPDIVFNSGMSPNPLGTWYILDGVLRALSGDGSGEVFVVTDPALRTYSGSNPAAGDLDGDGVPEIVTCYSNLSSDTPPVPRAGGLLAFSNTGGLKWRTTDPRVEVCGTDGPAIADLDGDGFPEVIIRHVVVDGRTGAVRWVGSVPAVFTTVADVNPAREGDGANHPEVVGSNVVYRYDGTVLWHRADVASGYPAVADLDGDGAPDIAMVASGTHEIRALHAVDGTDLWGPFDVNQGHADPADPYGMSGGGPPTIADFDGDGKPEVATAGGWGYVVFEGESGAPKWFTATQDLSSRVTGSSVFDFEGDGAAEVVYNDELKLRIYDGATGAVLWSACNTSGTLFEYPLIVDVDNDGHAEIVVANNNYAFPQCADGTASHTGIRVFGDAQNNWVRTRRIWNQHTYHVTNVDERGRVPAVEARNWTVPGLNNFRQNVQPEGLFDAPDFIPVDVRADQSSCPASLTLVARVVNQGAAGVPAGVTVTFFVDDQDVGTVHTTHALLPGGSEYVSLQYPLPAGQEYQPHSVHVVVDSAGAHHECVETNNRSADVPVTCPNLE
jgi:hypothetical protein